MFTDTVSEWLRRWTRNPLGSARRGSNPLGVVFFSALLEYFSDTIQNNKDRKFWVKVKGSVA